MRVPFEGGAPESVTPSLSPYSPAIGFGDLNLAISRDGSRIAFTGSWEDGFHVYIMDVDGDDIGKPQEIYYNRDLLTPPLLSQAGEILVIGTTER